MDYLQRKKEIEAKFNQKVEEFKRFQEQANILQQAINENTAERNRLQGEFRLLEDMIKEEPTLKPPKKKK